MKSSQNETNDLPRQLPDGLLLRWATAADSEELAAFNLGIHSDDPDNPEMFLSHWTRDLLSGIHPTTDASDFTVVVDTKADNRIVSSLCTISQVWSFAGIPIPVGRPELVGTNPDYRRRGLVRHQMDVIHARSAAKGEMLNVITGIPWYYRQFDYEMAVEIGGSRQFFWERSGNDATVESEVYTVRPATVDDIPVLNELYARHTAGNLLVRVRPDSHWRYEIEESHPESVGRQGLELVEKLDGTPVGYVTLEQWGTSFTILEFGVAEGHSWRAVALFLTREYKRRMEELNQTRKKPITNISFALGSSHPAYDALGNQLERQTRPYSYYVRVPDIAGFLRRVKPVLEQRIADSVLAGHTGSVKVNLYRERFELIWEEGELKDIAPYEVKRLEDGDVRFPDLTFLQLLFGYRSFEELQNTFTDCYASKVEARLLMEILFPKTTSHVIALN